MEIRRSKIINKFPWLKQKNCKYIISSSYEGLICSSFLNHFLDWKLVGYYDLEKLWISEEAKKNKKNIIWVDLNILPIQGRAIGGHIVALDNEIPGGFKSSCNPNILVRLSSNDFKYKYPFSTIMFLLWLHNKKILDSDESRFALLHADDTWLKYQKYNSNCKLWINTLNDYNWGSIFDKANNKTFEKKIGTKYYPYFQSKNFFNQKGKIKSQFYNIISKQLWFNPDWDEDIILNILSYFAKTLEWTPPVIPTISDRIDGLKSKIDLKEIKAEGINNFVKTNKVFSYAIPSKKTFSYTVFNKMKQNPIYE